MNISYLILKLLPCSQNWRIVHLYDKHVNSSLIFHTIYFQLRYLRRFKNLKTLNLSDNPFCKQDEYKQYVIAFLSNLEFLDYRLVDQQSVSIIFSYLKVF